MKTIIAFTIGLGLALLVPLSVVYAPPGSLSGLYPTGRLGAMLDAIRERETVAVKPWVWADSRWQMSPCAVGGTSEFGPWQIRLVTMKWQLKDKRGDWEIIADLCNPTVAPLLAAKVFKDCWRRGWRSNRKALTCYNGGPRSKSQQARDYADDVMSRYERILERG